MRQIKHLLPECCILIICSLILFSTIGANAQETKTVLYPNGTLVINELDSAVHTNSLKYGGFPKFYSAISYDFDSKKEDKPWEEFKKEVYRIEFGSEVKPKNTSRMFIGMSNCMSIDLTNLNTENVTDMSNMFGLCENLTRLNLTMLNTDNVTNMSGMFERCIRLASLDLSSFNIENVSDMSYMFWKCESLKSLVLNECNAWNLKYMGLMFSGCSSLDSLDFSWSLTFRNSSGDIIDRYMRSMFSDCSSLKSLDFRVIDSCYAFDMGFMFSGCSSLKTLDLRGEFVGVESMDLMFYMCRSLDSLDLTGFRTIKAGTWLEECNNLKIYVANDFKYHDADGHRTSTKPSNWIYENPTNLVFSGLSFRRNTNIIDLKKGDTATFKVDIQEGKPDRRGIIMSNSDTSVAILENGKITAIKEGETEIVGRAEYGSARRSFFVKVFDTNRTVLYTDSLFVLNETPDNRRRDREVIYSVFDKWTTFNPTTPSLNEGIKSRIKAIKVDKDVDVVLKFGEIFSDFVNCESIDLSNTAHEVRNDLFKACRNLKHIKIGRSGQSIHLFDVMGKLIHPGSVNPVNQEHIGLTFEDCTSLIDVDLSRFQINLDTYHIESWSIRYDSVIYDISKMFANCTKLTTIYVSDTMMSAIEGMVILGGIDVFKNCKKLKGGNGTVYSADNIDYTYARIDRDGAPGYFTSVNPQKITLSAKEVVCKKKSDVKQLEATIWHGTPDKKGVQWISTNKEVAEVENGVVIPVGEGKTFIIAISEYNPLLQDSCEVTVLPFQTPTDKQDSPPCRTVLYSDGLLVINENLANARSDEGAIILEGWTTANPEEPTIDDEMRSKVKAVRVATEFTPSRCDEMFRGFTNCESMDLKKLNTKGARGMSSMFADCRSLKALDLSNFQTENVEYMIYMFSSCENLEYLDLSSFDTRNAKYMYSMFGDCLKLPEIIFGENFTCEKCESFNHMFTRCESVTELDLSMFNTANVTDMTEMFFCCYKLQAIYVSDKFVNTSVTGGGRMFGACNSLEGGNGTRYMDDKDDYTYARIDKDGEPGYFTDVNDYGKITYIEIVPTSLTLEKWQSADFLCVIFPKSAIGQELVFTSSDDSIISVAYKNLTATELDVRNLIFAQKGGFAKINVQTKDGRRKAVCEVTVIDNTCTETELQPIISIYPNPASDQINFSAEVNYQIYTTTGKCLLQGLSSQVNVSKLPRGLYVVEYTLNGLSRTEKIVLQ